MAGSYHRWRPFRAFRQQVETAMSRRIALTVKTPAPARNNAARSGRKFVTLGKRARISSATLRGPYLPPEQWYEPKEEATGRYAVITQAAGSGYRHVVTEDD